MKDHTLESCLNKLDMMDLYNLGFRLLMLPPEDRNDRGAWVRLLCEALRKDPLSPVLCLTQGEWSAVKGTLAQSEDGLILRFADVNRDLILADAVDQLRSLGLCWRDRHAWHVNPDINMHLDTVDTLGPVMEVAERVYTATLGYLRIYGLMPAADLSRMVAPLLKDENLPNVRDDNFIINLWRCRNGLTDMLMATDGLWLVSPAVEEVDALYAKLHDESLADRSYAPYTIDEALRCGKGGLPGRIDAYDELIAYFSVHKVPRAAIMSTVDDAILLEQQGNTDAAIQLLNSLLPTHITGSQDTLFRCMLWRVPQWKLKGSCVEEMMPPNRRAFSRTRQDDLCPCGSHRKYKYCCGRLQ